MTFIIRSTLALLIVVFVSPAIIAVSYKSHNFARSPALNRGQFKKLLALKQLLSQNSKPWPNQTQNTDTKIENSSNTPAQESAVEQKVPKSNKNVDMSYVEYLLKYKPDKIQQINNNENDENSIIVSENGKKYKVLMKNEEFMVRQKILKNSIEEINNHNNSPAGLSFQKGLNKFADYTTEEMAVLFGGLDI